MNREVMFSSATDEWATPQGFFDELNKEFHFTLDPAANKENHKCESFFTKEQNGLACPWGGDTRCFAILLTGARLESGFRKRGRNTRRMEIPSLCFFRLGRTHDGSTSSFTGKAEIRFVRGRLKFGNATNSAPFPSMVVIWGGDIR